MKSPFKKIPNVFASLNEFSKNRVQGFGAQYSAFGIFGIINYIMPFFMWSHEAANNETMLSLRTIASLLCLFLIIRDYWPEKIRRWIPLYWHFTLMYCLPFFTTYMLLGNHGSLGWLMNMVLAIFSLILLVDWLSFMLILILGVASGWTGYWILEGPSTLAENPEVLEMALYMYFFAMIIGIIFSRNKQKTQNEKLNAIKMLSGAIAHELRTPLGSIAAGAEGIQEHLPKLLNGYDLAKAANLPVQEIDPMHYEALKGVSQRLCKVSRDSQMIINMLLMNIKESPVEETLNQHSMSNCIHTALEQYPFSQAERELITLQEESDFEFLGNKTLMVHVLFNLFKNSLYALKAANKGMIHIRLEKHNDFNILYFKDGGTGITPKTLPNIFNRFYSRTKHGTGIGLAFCKLVIEGFGGSIICRSEVGIYTEFVIRLPVLNNEKALQS